jgi:Protein of unknown function (DUF4232)/Aspartic acid proteinase inhibitor
MKKMLFNFSLLLIAAAALNLSSPAQVIAGGYNTISTGDAGVAAAARFAVKKRVQTNSEQEGLKLKSIEKAETQVVAGLNYKLCLNVSLGAESQQVEAVVYKNLRQEMQLTSWSPSNCGDAGARTSGGGTGPGAGTGRKTDPQTKAASCTGKQLSLKEGEPESDIGGKRFGNYVFTNISSTPCTLSGFPTFVMLDKSNKAMTAEKVDYKNNLFGEEENKGAAPVVILDPNKTAWFQIYYNDGMALEHKNPYPTSASIEVTAPKTDHKFTLKSEIQACCGIQVSSIRAGAPSQE